MPQEETCKISFTTTGLAFAVSESYVTYSGYARKIVEVCTIQQLYRYTLAQFEYQCYKSSASSSMSSPLTFLDIVTNYRTNFSCIVEIIDSYGRFTQDSCTFWTVAPPIDVHSPHTVRLSNLRAIVEKLSKSGDKDFMKENTLPGAIFDADGVLQNPNDIMPEKYDEESFESDAHAVQSALDALYKYPAFIARCMFSDVGHASTLISTALQKNGPYDSIRLVKSAARPEDATGESQSNVTSCSLKLRDWYSIHSSSDGTTKRGILSYCGVWSEKLESQWTDMKVRYPGASKHLKYDVSWSSAFLDTHNSLRSAVLLKEKTIDEEMQSVTCRVPFTTTGLAFAVNDLYATYQNKPFADYCTVHQLYRHTLVQFEFQCYIVGQAQHQAHYYPYLDSFFFMYKRLESSGAVNAYAENFRNIVTIIDSYGYFQREKCKFGTIPPPIHVHNPHTVRISNLRAIVEKLATGDNENFVNENTIPGAIFNAEGVLLNADEIMPSDYDEEVFLSDARAVRRAFQQTLHGDDWKNNVASCKFSSKGKPSALVTTSVQEARDYIPVIEVSDQEQTTLKKTKITSTTVGRRQWYSIHPLNDVIMKFGISSYCGVWSESLEKSWPDMRIRNPASAKQLKLETWFVDDKFMV